MGVNQLRRGWVSLAIAASGLVATPASAAVVLKPVATLSAPIFLTHAGDSRLFIVEQGGRIRIFERSTSTLIPSPFLDIASKISTGGERGLLSVAFHPDYATNGFFYVCYTNASGSVVVERYRRSTAPNSADPASGAVLLTVPKPFANHNGGQLQVGRDGHLYVGLGDGGGSGDPSCYAQRKDTYLGKILRLDIRNNVITPPFYAIPSDNPFTVAGDPTGEIPDEIWATGLRNPWRFSFDRLNGDLYIGDVGQSLYEEVDLHRFTSPAGQNFGWKVMEGLHCNNSAGCPAGTPACNSAALTLPIHEYGRAGGCSITGGYVYRGAGTAELAGRYVFGDYCQGEIRTLREISPGNWQSEVVSTGGSGLTSFGEDSEGELYVMRGNTVAKLTSNVVSVPSASGPWQAALAFALASLGVASVRRRKQTQA